MVIIFIVIFEGYDGFSTLQVGMQILFWFLADRTNGQTNATVLSPSVAVVCNVMYCG